MALVGRLEFALLRCPSPSSDFTRNEPVSDVGVALRVDEVVVAPVGVQESMEGGSMGWGRSRGSWKNKRGCDG